eukprot:6185545-Pleurochrysis_carterae.AAC.3
MIVSLTSRRVSRQAPSQGVSATSLSMAVRARQRPQHAAALKAGESACTCCYCALDRVLSIRPQCCWFALVKHLFGDFSLCDVC